MTTTESDKSLRDIGESAYESIREMVAALQCDYDLLESLQDERDTHETGGADWDEKNPDDAEELVQLRTDAGDCTDQDEARERIEQDALSVELGGFWTLGETPEASEFRILLTTGGPAVRIIGDIGAHGDPESARLEVQDWFKPWTQYDADEDVLLAYAGCFIFAC
jgi:hypothetical protein